jgi:AhpD family alkylhydroperoxidase
MSRNKPVLETTHEGVRRSFDAIETQLGVVPNMMRTMAQSPRVLEGYLALSGALGRGLLPATLQEQIALAVAETNACNYCLSAHTALGRRAGLSDDQLAASREGRAAEAKANAALQFALAVLEHRGATRVAGRQAGCAL